jgi:hypothetical protein
MNQTSPPIGLVAPYFDQTGVGGILGAARVDNDSYYYSQLAPSICSLHL